MNGVTGKGPDLAPVPDRPQTALALRVWRRSGVVLKSLNAPLKQPTFVGTALSSGPVGGWPTDDFLVARCAFDTHKDEPVPGKTCTCGIYASTDLDVIATYLNRDAPVLGIVELGGSTVPADFGYRAAKARIAAILLVDEILTEPHGVLRSIADHYRIPAVIPHSADPEDYRDIVSQPSVVAEAEDFLRRQT